MFFSDTLIDSLKPAPEPDPQPQSPGPFGALGPQGPQSPPAPTFTPQPQAQPDSYGGFNDIVGNINESGQPQTIQQPQYPGAFPYGEVAGGLFHGLTDPLGFVGVPSNTELLGKVGIPADRLPSAAQAGLNMVRPGIFGVTPAAMADQGIGGLTGDLASQSVHQVDQSLPDWAQSLVEGGANLVGFGAGMHVAPRVRGGIANAAGAADRALNPADLRAAAPEAFRVGNIPGTDANPAASDYLNRQAMRFAPPQEDAASLRMVDDWLSQRVPADQLAKMPLNERRALATRLFEAERAGTRPVETAGGAPELPVIGQGGDGTQGSRASWATPVGERYQSAQDAIDTFEDGLRAKYGAAQVDAAFANTAEMAAQSRAMRVDVPPTTVPNAEVQRLGTLYAARDAIGSAQDANALISVVARLSPEATSIVDERGVQSVIKSIQDEIEIYAHNGAAQPYATPQAIADRVYQGLVNQAIKDGKAIDAFRGDPNDAMLLYRRGVIGSSPEPLIKQAGAIVRDTLGGYPQGATISGASRRQLRGGTPTAGGAPALPAPPPSPPVQPAEVHAAGGRPAGTAEALTNAAEMVRQDKPTAAGRFLDRIPVVRNVRGFMRPGLDMPDSVLTANVAQHGTSARLQQAAFETEQAFLSDVRREFGADAVQGKPTSARFIGTPDEATVLVKGKSVPYPGIGTVKDIADRPQLYDLTPQQRSVLASGEARNEGLRATANDQYGAKINKYPVPEGGMHLPTSDRSEAQLALDELRSGGASSTSTVTSAASKTRVFESAFDRWASDMRRVVKGELKPEQVVVPETDLQTLVRGMDNSKINAAAGSVFRDGLGGKTRMDIVEQVSPALAKRVQGLRQRIQTLQSDKRMLSQQMGDALDAFVGSAMEPADVAELQSALALKPGRYVAKARAGVDSSQLAQTIAGLKADLHAIKPALEGVNLRGNTFVADGIYRYFPAEDAAKIRGLLAVENGPLSGLVKATASVNSTVLGGDFSPIIGQQGQIAWLTAPVQTSKAVGGAIMSGLKEGDLLHAFRASTLAERAAQNPQWQRYAESMGFSLRTSTPEELQGGWLGDLLAKVPGGAKYREANQGIYSAVRLAQFNGMDSLVQSAVSRGVPEGEAIAAAADTMTKLIPTGTPARMGQSPALQQALRTPFTSINFIQKPIALMEEGIAGLAKTAMPGQQPTERERQAMVTVLKLFGDVLAISATSQALEAARRGEDPVAAALAAVNPDPKNKHFANLKITGTDIEIPLGGAYRAVVRAVAPTMTDTPIGKIPAPFTGVPAYFKNRIQPTARALYAVSQNDKGYGGGPVYDKDAGAATRLMQIAGYMGQSALPLAAAQPLDSMQRGRTFTEGAVDTAAQVAGTNVVRPSVTERVQAGEYAKLSPQDQFKGLRAASWDSMRSAYPADTANYPTYFDWLTAQRGTFVKQFTAQGMPVAVAAQKVDELLATHPIVKGYTELHNANEDQWALNHPKEAIALLDAEAMLSFDKKTFSPSKKVRDMLAMYPR